MTIQILDPGHEYVISGIGGGEPQFIKFVKNLGEKYPGNKPPAHGGMQTQDLIRIGIDRTEYLNSQGSCFETEMALAALRQALAWYEARAARCMGEHLQAEHMEDIEKLRTCNICGHIACRRITHEHLPGTER